VSDGGAGDHGVDDARERAGTLHRVAALSEPSAAARQPEVVIRRLDSQAARRHLDELADLLVDAVAGGASVSFVAPLSHYEARDWFAGVLHEMELGRRVMLAAFMAGRVVGCAQLVLAWQSNATHRAEVQKMLVHGSARRRGVGARLMRRLEVEARALGRTLLVLDTETGSDAEHLYAHLGWTRVGVIPDYAMRPDGAGLRATSLWYRKLD
jgi:GNAT superfamily N-acetyltransferase